MARALVIFGGQSCPWTQRMRPILEKLRKHYEQYRYEVPFYYVEAPQEPEMNYRWGVRATPTMFVVDMDQQQTKVLRRFDGPVGIRELHDAIVS